MTTGAQSKSQSVLETHREGRVHNPKADSGPLHGVTPRNAMPAYFLSDCDRCGKHTYVTEFESSREWREHGEETGTRCAVCIWAMKRIFTWREWRPEDSPLFIGNRPAILDARGVPLRPGCQVERSPAAPVLLNQPPRPGTGKISLP